jgi:hypothetical protein
VNELEKYLTWVSARLDQNELPREEPDLELKSSYKDQSEAEALWELSDLLASLANDIRVDGFRALVFGPLKGLARPSWFPDEAVIRDKLLRHFEGGVVPRIEVVRRELASRGDFDAFVIVERDSPPYVTRLGLGGPWAVRIRSNTARRTATRAELVALAGGHKPSGQPVRQLDARVAPLGKGTKKIVVTNTGTIPVRDIRLKLPDDAETRPFSDRGVAIPLLNPSERDNIAIIGFTGLGRGLHSERVTVIGTADDGEPVSTTVLIPAFD